MVLSSNKINYKGESGLNTNGHVSRDNTVNGQLKPKPPQTYSESWYVRDASTYGHSAGAQLDSSCCCWEPSGAAQPAMRCPNGPQSAANMVASYGVYSDANLRADEDEDGFVPRAASAYRGVVVNAAGDSAVVRPRHLQDAAPADAACGWCLGPTPTDTPQARTSCAASWCRPTILLLILVLLVVVFVTVSGILLYFNCMFTVMLFACFKKFVFM